MDAIVRLAANVRRLRIAANVAQEEFADNAEIDRTYVSGIERGKRNPSVKMIERIAMELKVDVAELLREPTEDPAATPQRITRPSRAPGSKPPR